MKWTSFFCMMMLLCLCFSYAKNMERRGKKKELEWKTVPAWLDEYNRLSSEDRGKVIALSKKCYPKGSAVLDKLDDKVAIIIEGLGEQLVRTVVEELVVLKKNYEFYRKTGRSIGYFCVKARKVKGRPLFDLSLYDELIRSFLKEELKKKKT